ncbi:hypothetical protein IJG89_00275 [Candidatus Saccharibacteria bacterium]|nr:hypothetical protein [Candidatus Saccharibacteria bacterium]
MNLDAVLVDIWRNNRKMVFGLGILTFGLIIANAIVVGIKNYEVVEPDDGDYVVGDTFYSEREPEKSEEDVSEYIDDLHDLIRMSYGEKMDGYEIATGKLLESNGLWYVTTIKKPLKDQWSPATDTYKIILSNNGGWKIVTEPSLVFSYADYPDIPQDVIVSANTL